MSKTDSTKPVVVGVDETPAAQKGVQYAALEARRSGTRLSILHVTPGYTPAAGLPPAPDDVLQSYGFELLEHARKHAQAIGTGPRGRDDPGRRQHQRSGSGRQLRPGGPRRPRRRASVVRRPRLDRRHRRRGCRTGNVPGRRGPARMGVDARPRPRRRGREGHRSTQPTSSHAGLALADELDAELVVVHAWKAPSGYDDIIVNRTEADEYVRHQKALLDRLVQAGREAHPDVAVRVEVLHAQAAHALVSASAHADRLLISRPRHGGVLHHLGYVARALLNEARCPVEVHPAREIDAEVVTPQGEQEVEPETIVVGIDGSPASRLALDWALEQARIEGRSITLVHAIHALTPVWQEPGAP